jgi:hypothetical protein
VLDAGLARLYGQGKCPLLAVVFAQESAPLKPPLWILPVRHVSLVCASADHVLFKADADNPSYAPGALRRATPHTRVGVDAAQELVPVPLRSHQRLGPAAPHRMGEVVRVAPGPGA